MKQELIQFTQEAGENRSKNKCAFLKINCRVRGAKARVLKGKKQTKVPTRNANQKHLNRTEYGV